MNSSAVHPTIFIRRDGNDSLRAVDVASGRATGVERVSWRIGNATGESVLERLVDGAGRFFVSDVREKVKAEFTLLPGGERHEVDWVPAYHWRVVLIPIAHHDYGYTGTIDEVLEQYRFCYRQVLKFCRDTDCYPDDAKFRYQAEQAWSLLDFLEHCTPEERDEMADRIREGRVELPALLGNQTLCLHGGEELVRLLYPSFELKRTLGVPVTGAAITDIPGLAWSLPSVLAGSGIRHFFAGLPTYFEWYRTKVHSFWDEEGIMPEGRPYSFRWEGPDGASVLVHYQGGYGVWTPNAPETVVSELPEMLGPLVERGYPHEVFRCAWNGMDNRLPDARCSDLALTWNEEWEWPRLVVGTSSTFFDRIDTPDLPVLRGDLPDTDYVVGATSTAHHVAVNRVAREQLVAAEVFGSVGSGWFGQPYGADRASAAWRNVLMFDEHTWGMETSFAEREGWNRSRKSNHALHAGAEAESLMDESLKALAYRVARRDDETTIVVFNRHAQPHSDLVRLPFIRLVTHSTFRDIETLEFDPEQYDLVDVETGTVVPVEVVEVEASDPDLFAPGRYSFGRMTNPIFAKDLVFAAKDVPGIGYRSYAVRKRSAPACVPTASVTKAGTRIENEFFRVEVDPASGRIVHVIDKQTGRYLVDPDAPHGFGDPLARSAEDGELRPFVPDGPATVTTGSIVSRIRRTGTCMGMPRIVFEITLYNDVPRVEVAMRVLRDSVPALEHFAYFPFAMRSPGFHVESAGAFIDPWTDSLPGTNTNYIASDGVVEIAEEDYAVDFVSRDAHVIHPGGPNPSYVSQAHHGVTAPGFGEPFRDRPDTGHVAVLLATDNFRTNFSAIQSGDMVFRFSISTRAETSNPVRSREFGRLTMMPLVPRKAVGDLSEELPVAGSFVEIEPKSVALSALKAAEDGRGLILRLRDTAGVTSEASVRFNGVEVVRACLTNLVEEDGDEVPLAGGGFSVAVPANGMTTVRFEVRPEAVFSPR